MLQGYGAVQRRTEKVRHAERIRLECLTKAVRQTLSIKRYCQGLEMVNVYPASAG